MLIESIRNPSSLMKPHEAHLHCEVPTVQEQTKEDSTYATCLQWRIGFSKVGFLERSVIRLISVTRIDTMRIARCGSRRFLAGIEE